LGGATYTKAGELLKKNPVKMVEMAVRGMVPRNRLGSQIFTKLHVYAGPEHPHAAQKPEVLTIDIR
jgi:large subunit ribosomal protein L13